MGELFRRGRAVPLGMGVLSRRGCAAPLGVGVVSRRGRVGTLGMGALSRRGHGGSVRKAGLPDGFIASAGSNRDCRLIITGILDERHASRALRSLFALRALRPLRSRRACFTPVPLVAFISLVALRALRTLRADERGEFALGGGLEWRPRDGENPPCDDLRKGVPLRVRVAYVDGEGMVAPLPVELPAQGVEPQVEDRGVVRVVGDGRHAVRREDGHPDRPALRRRVALECNRGPLAEERPPLVNRERAGCRVDLDSHRPVRHLSVLSVCWSIPRFRPCSRGAVARGTRWMTLLSRRRAFRRVRGRCRRASARTPSAR